MNAQNKIITSMKFLLTALFVSMLGSVHGQTPASDFKKLYWLEGSWAQTNSKKPGQTSVECWMKSAEFILSGKTVTLQGKDTLFIEKATLLVKDNAIYYVANVPQNKESVYFKVISLTDAGFVCENKTHDFPKKISYILLGNILRATISGNGRSIDYIFRKT